MSTLNYAQTATGIINKPLSSSYISITPSGFTNNNSNNDSSISEYATSAESWAEMECRLQYMQAQVDEAQAALARKHMQQQEFVEKIEKLEEEKLDLERDHFNTTQTLNRTTAELLKEKEEKQNLAISLDEAEQTIKKTTTILRATQQTEINLTSEATSLLSTLREAIVDGDSLHKLLQEAREAERKTKVAAKLFQASVVTNLDDVTTCLNELTNRVKEHSTAMAESVVLNNNAEHNALAESVVVIESIKAAVHHLMQYLRSHTVDEDGLSPIITKLCTNINDSIEAVRSNFTDGETTLSTGLDEILQAVEQHSTTLSDMNASFLTTSSSISAQLHQAMENIRDSYSGIVTKASNSIKVMRCFNEASRSDLAALVSDWKASCDSSLSDIDNKASVQWSRLTTSIGKFEKDWQHHDEMEKLLSNQHTFMKRQGDIYTNTLTSLDDKLIRQQEALGQESRRQQAMRDEFTKRVMEGVQMVVKSQIEQIVLEHSLFISSIDSRNAELIDTSGQLRLGSTTILQNVDDTKVALCKALESAVGSDRDMRDVAQESRVCLEGIRNTSIRGKDDMSCHTASARRFIDDLNGQDTNLGRAVESMLSESQAYSDKDMNQILNESTYNVSQLTKAGISMFDYSTKVLATGMKMSLQSVQNERPLVSENLRKNLDKATHTSRSTEEAVKDIVNTMAQVTDMVGGDVESKINTFNSVNVPRDRAVMDTHKESLLQMINDCQNLSNSLVSSSSSGLRTSRGRVLQFANNVVGIDKNVASVDLRRNFVFSDKLSVTPATDIILGQSCLQIDKQTSTANPVCDDDDSSTDSMLSFKTESSNVTHGDENLRSQHVSNINGVDCNYEQTSCQNMNATVDNPATGSSPLKEFLSNGTSLRN